MDLKLYYKAECPFCKKVLRFIENKKIEGVELVDIKADEANEKYLIEKGGMDQVPCLFIDEKPMYESMDIIKFLDEKFQ
ncbi:glutaredoxin [Finegoldia magna SY403409CC001050417]|uniref:Glutathione S-transferase N-terminal domain-containing protein n=1 Tax=Finegoldia magna TaxID=1260 RepID=A0A7D4JM48_FINMA|nr:glutathione S-transferase N-terminal domain-containing protein [Finegoldia magna]EGS34019.1 glutaredoxin [Finegoldia magna SY403409CC001050417]QKH79660.1 glutathione S-transferase N-terminal domain-containing protein [Finegoldia magna]